MTFWELLTLILIGIPLFGISSIIPMLIWTHHRRRMEELRQRGRNVVAEDIRTEFATLRSEIRDLRDTTMQYDLSFDTALQQMDRRLSKIERQGFEARPETAAPHNIPYSGR